MKKLSDEDKVTVVAISLRSGAYLQVRQDIRNYGKYRFL